MIIGAYNPACLVSLVGVGFAAAAMILASTAHLELALIGLILAGLADVFDGVVARRLKLNDYEREYGVQLDTVVDVVAFVATPVVIALHAGIDTGIARAGLGAFVLAGVIRLAHFNTLHMRGTASTTHHRGLPVTYTALVFPIAFVARDTLAPAQFATLLALLFPLLAALFVLDIPVAKPRGVFYLVLPLLAALLIAYWLGRYSVSVQGV